MAISRASEIEVVAAVRQQIAVRMKRITARSRRPKTQHCQRLMQLVIAVVVIAGMASNLAFSDAGQRQ